MKLSFPVVFDYTEKYTLKTSKIHMPARIDAATELRIQEAAKTIFKALDCSGFARVDMFLTPAERSFLMRSIRFPDLPLTAAIRI